MRPTPSLLSRMPRKLRLTTKSAPNRGGYYKGTGTGAMGWHTKHGGYKIDPKKVRTYVVPPGVHSSQITPFVTKTLKAKKTEKPFDGKAYLEKWKHANGSS